MEVGRGNPVDSRKYLGLLAELNIKKTLGNILNDKHPHLVKLPIENNPHKKIGKFQIENIPH